MRHLHILKRVHKTDSDELVVLVRPRGALRAPSRVQKESSGGSTKNSQTPQQRLALGCQHRRDLFHQRTQPMPGQPHLQGKHSSTLDTLSCI
jgi:hypothetical protein